MEAFELILLLMVAVLLSSVLDQVVPRISSPLIQIGLGVIIAFLAISPIQDNRPFQLHRCPNQHE